jgi:hypothetical protein
MGHYELRSTSNIGRFKFRKKKTVVLDSPPLLRHPRTGSQGSIQCPFRLSRNFFCISPNLPLSSNSSSSLRCCSYNCPRRRAPAKLMMFHLQFAINPLISPSGAQQTHTVLNFSLTVTSHALWFGITLGMPPPPPPSHKKRVNVNTGPALAHPVHIIPSPRYRNSQA